MKIIKVLISILIICGVILSISCSSSSSTTTTTVTKTATGAKKATLPFYYRDRQPGLFESGETGF